MKKIIAFIAALMCAVPVTTNFINNDSISVAAETAENVTESDFVFKISSDSEQNKFAVITKYEGSDSVVSVPSVVTDENGEEYTVTVLECSCFENNTVLEKVIIPNTITDLKTNLYYTSKLFYGCTNLKEVVFEEGSRLEIIDMETFSGCTSLENIVLPDSVNMISENAFKGCSALKEIDLNNIKTIKQYAFDGCESLESINLSEGLETIEDFAFLNCPSMKSVTIPESVTAIGKFAFGATSEFSWVTGTGVAYKPVNGFVVNGYEGSEAQAYVERTGKISFNAISKKPAGDVNGDGEVTSSDALNVLQAVTNIVDLTEEQKKLADLDGDGEITSADALFILQIIVGLR